MLLGLVEGVAVSHHKHRSMYGWKLLLVQPLNLAGRPSGDPVLAVDSLGAGRGDRILISSDGRGTRELLGDTTTPVRWATVGIVDVDGLHLSQAQTKPARQAETEQGSR